MNFLWVIAFAFAVGIASPQSQGNSQQASMPPFQFNVNSQLPPNPSRPPVDSMDPMMLMMMMMTIMDGGDNDMRMMIPMMMMMNNRGSSGGTGPDMMMPMIMMMMIAGRKKPKREREREKEGEPHWSYEGNSGPAYWGDLFPECNGLSQSPIDISTDNISPISEPSPLTFSNYNEGNKDLKNKGTSVVLDFEDDADVGILSGGPLEGDYKIRQLHFHWGKDDSRGSEHTVDSREFPLELHVVHTKGGVEDPMNTPFGLAVTGFFFEIDSDEKDNEALAPMIDAFSDIQTAGSKINFAQSGFRLGELMEPVAPISGAAAHYSAYSGSLTTPACNEVVQWINFINPLKISTHQMSLFRTLLDKNGEPIGDNYRPPQPLNGRTVTFYQ